MLIRAGRFDRSIEVKVPCGKDARQIIEHYMNQKPFVGEMDYDVITRLMEGRSCAELETVINEAGLYAGFQRSETVTMEHFLKACMRVLFRINYNGEEKIPKKRIFHAFSMENAPQIYKTAYHEATHVVAHEVIVPGSVTLSAICAGDRGQDGCKNETRRNGYRGVLDGLSLSFSKEGLRFAGSLLLFFEKRRIRRRRK